MSRKLWITDEVRDWLIGLRTRDPSAARLAGEAVIGLLDESPGPPLAVPVDLLLWADDPREALSHAYQRQLVLVQKVRRAGADIASRRKRLELHIQQLEATVRRLGDQIRMADEAGRHDIAQETRERQAGLEDTLADLRQAPPELRREEEEATLAGQRLAYELEGWRARREQVQIAYLVGQAKDTIEGTLAEAGGQRVAHEPAPHTAAARSAVETHLDSARRMEREHAGPPLALHELRLGAVTEHDLRILFAVEPSGTVLLLSATEGPGTWHQQGYLDEDLRRAESGQDEDTKESFLREYFPDEVEERQAGAARLLALNRVRVLAGVRRRIGLTQEQVAGRVNATTERVAAIESAELDTTEVGALAAYAEAIGGRMEIVVDLGTERVSLR